MERKGHMAPMYFVAQAGERAHLSPVFVVVMQAPSLPDA
jgi:hypothetical protein